MHFKAQEQTQMIEHASSPAPSKLLPNFHFQPDAQVSLERTFVSNQHKQNLVLSDPSQFGLLSIAAY